MTFCPLYATLPVNYLRLGNYKIMHTVRIGSVFKVKSSGGNRYFQFVGRDDGLMGSDVIAVFEGTHNTELPTETITKLAVEFFSHTYPQAGMPEFWEFVGSTEPVSMEEARFADVDMARESRDPAEGDSKFWQIWRPGGARELLGEFNNLPPGTELGALFPPEAMHRRITSGKYGQAFYGHSF